MKNKVTAGTIFPVVVLIFLGTFLIGSSIPTMHQSHAQQQNSTTANTNNNNNSNNLLTYENSNYGIKIQYPSSWMKEESHNQSSNDIVRFSSPAGIALLSIVSTGRVSESKPLELYANAGIDVLRHTFSDFSLISSNSSTVGGIPAQEIVYTASMPSGLKLKFMQFLTIKDARDFILTSGALQDEFAKYLPTIQTMVNSFSFIPGTTVLPASNESGSKIAAANQSGSISFVQTSNSGVASFDAAKDQYLTAWNHTTLHSTFDTFIQNGSDRGYGVYLTHPPVFRPGETMVLYVEPVGYGFKQVVDEQGNILNQINFTASITIAGSNGTQLASIKDVPIGLINSHNKNTEMFITLDVSQHTPFPLGDYMITYNIKDGTGKSFQIVKPVKIANVVRSGTL
jgi:PsbP-like protein